MYVRWEQRRENENICVSEHDTAKGGSFVIVRTLVATSLWGKHLPTHTVGNRHMHMEKKHIHTRTCTHNFCMQSLLHIVTFT